MRQQLKLHGLMKINSTHLVDRYNRALKASCRIETNLTSFHIDCSGYSPEIAEECGDIDYLNTNGANKRFIIVSVEQVKLPIAQSYFSSTVHFVKQFITDNYKQILSMTAIDSIYGELENNTYRIKNLDDLVYATKIEVKLETSRGLIGSELALKSMLTNLNELDDESWLDDYFLSEVINVVDKIGDIRKNSLQPSVLHYEKKFFHTKHLGGVYVLKKEAEIIVLGTDDVLDELKTSNSEFILKNNVVFHSLNNVSAIYSLLVEENMIDELSVIKVNNSVGEIDEYIKRIVIEHMISIDDSLTYLNDQFSESEIKRHILDHYDDLGELFHVLSDLSKRIKRGEELETIEEEILFYFLKSSSHSSTTGNQDIVNHLISNYTPFKYESNFISNRDMFFASHNDWSDKKKNFVEDLITRAI
ncbi:DUF6638 family protein [Psychromonas sp. SP041]|uniref:DUF6638 family protein n=1 Tax=Psychromonas sp. SP041 TaxID=1365007 RepID=UPI0010C7BC61|nr:DUF6638 family protein [Psychromonas sp. SP041]